MNTVFVWARQFPDYTERLTAMAGWCRVHMAQSGVECLSLVPKD